MTKHTPGPWVYYTEPQPNGCPIIGNDKGLMVAMLAHSVKEVGQENEAISNALLIAAAPELLDACRKALYALKGREHDGFLRDAISKATGERP